MDEKPEIKIEILRAEDLKPEIRDNHDLPDHGLVMKRSIRTSPSEDEYELLTSSFLTRLNKNIDKVSPELITKINSLV